MKMGEVKISGKTMICGIIGDPVEHTLSPVMQNAAFKETGLDYVYLPFRVKKEDLAGAVEGIRGMDFAGINVTIPHKVAVIPFLDEVDALAARIGAVNTIVYRGGKLKGYNTDAAGFYQAISEQGISVAEKKITILGAGGAARAIAFILAEKGAELMILNRSLDSARAIAERVFQTLRIEVKTGTLIAGNLKTVLDKNDIVVNATSIGMLPDVNETPVPAGLLRKGLTVVDIIYNPLKTRLLREAEEKGCRVIGGLEMLVRQGAASFELWTGLQAPVEVMRKAAEGALKTDEK
jgi:shikimate dehydrogenase